MKKLILLFALTATMMAVGNRASAQQQGVDLQFVGDSTWNINCGVPDTIGFFVYGMAGGYLPTDSILVEVYFGDGNSTSMYTPIIQNSYFWVSNIDHVYTLPGNYSVMVVATGPDGDIDTLIDNSVLIATSCGNVSGYAYIDSNGNCIFDQGETVLTNMQIAVMQGGNFFTNTYTDSLGYYNITLGSGFTYEISLNTNIAPVNCPAGGSYTVSTVPANNLNFGLSCVPGFDYTSNIYSPGFRPNFQSTVWIAPDNLLLSCNSPSATVTVTLDPLMSYVGSSLTPVNINGQQITYSVGSLSAVTNNQGFQMQVLTSLAANIGDTVCIEVQVDPVAGDADLSNNNITNCWPVRNSYDPNEKQEAFAGTGTANILPGTELNYTILFQNLGNDDAIDIYIIDTLDTALEPASFQFISSSHEPVITFHQGNIVRFEFKNIYLPAASVNEPASHGYVNYKIYAPHFLPNGTQIQNTAHIFFDFNPAIVTNTVTHIIDLTSGINTTEESTIQFYPNPAVNDLHIQQDDAQESTVEIFDITGKRVHFSNVKGSGSIEVSQLAKGSYILTVTGDRRSRSMKLIVQ